jgi:hypothetical protein
MPSEDEMTIDERRKYLKEQQERYRTATRKARELCGIDLSLTCKQEN